MLGLLQPAASGLRTLLALALTAGWGAFLLAFFALPAYLNSVINGLAASSPLSSPYYRRRKTAPSSAAGTQPHSYQEAMIRALAPVDSPLGPEPKTALPGGAAGDAAPASDVKAGSERIGPSAVGVITVNVAATAVSDGVAGVDQASGDGPVTAAQPTSVAPQLLPPALRYVRRDVWLRQQRSVGRRNGPVRSWGGATAATTAAAGATSAAPPVASSGGDAPAGGAASCGGRERVLQFDECMEAYGRVPPINVLIVVAGTRGDVQPATALGVRLRSHGHRVRLATHEPYRALVAGAGLEFFPLAGDPRGMMELTVKHRGMLFSSWADMSWLRGQYAQIMASCWAACTTCAPAQPPPPPAAAVARRQAAAASTRAVDYTGGDDGRAGRCRGVAAGEPRSASAAGVEPFKPDLIIATAITYGAVHCAEALGVPLHIISTIPWRPTREICHPWARGFEDTLTGHCSALAAAALPPPPAWAKLTALGSAYGKFAAAGRAAAASAANWWSSALLDHMAWLGIADLVVAFRRRLGLPLVSLRNTGFALYDVPTTFTFSPSLVPRPVDWGPHVAVSGPLLLPAEAAAGAGGEDAEGFVPPEGLVEFLEADPAHKPIYIGFGSMTVSEGRAVAAAIRAAVAATCVRAVVSAGGWGCLAPQDCKEAAATGGSGRVVCEDYEGGRAKSAELRNEARAGAGADVVSGAAPPYRGPEIFVVHDVPHDWLFPRCSAVIHHGGVGTTAAGLLAGCPTFVAPSFGDLFFWGELVARVGCGPPPVPIYSLTAADLERAIRVLQSEAARDAAKRAGAELRRADGLGVATRHIYRGLQAAARDPR
ncbi:hypothetical protein GPECTOR_106g121 [Gonium pectorale]|uniref:Uncharacterized protein n=1 Tax=Gonium pectorale TaxID=33097 RepID=A0A150FZM0_GONPE|nr:hypothetical protein GPECTOR_106g121 [Gonium pectorale]|eukprot:KXZ43027.1 hypothetical protein GPECTOR_106g121 [Gonium pectorale]